MSENVLHMFGCTFHQMLSLPMPRLCSIRAMRTLEELSAMHVDLIFALSTKSFQRELHDAYEAAGDPRKARAACLQVNLKHQGPIMPKYGFANSMAGVLMAFQGWPGQLINSYGPVFLRGIILHWLVTVE